jgi:predicted phage terminase large subunit-like protein
VLTGVTFEFVPSKADKITRADPFAAAVEAGNVKIVRTGDPDKDAWIRPYLDELAAFPFGKHDDRVDGTTLAFTKLTKPKKFVGVVR